MTENNIKISSSRLKDISFGMRVLLVEDDPIIQQQLKVFLLRFFAHIDTANNGVEALKLYEKDKYDLIITDLSMPQMGGIELSIHVKEMDTDQYIIVVSAHFESDKLIDLLNIGVGGFIIKPVDFTLVIKQLTKICQVISNRNELKYLNKILENKNKELQESNIQYQSALNESMNLKKQL